MPNSAMHAIGLGILLISALPAAAAGDPLAERLAALQRQNEELRRQSEIVQRQILELQAQMRQLMISQGSQGAQPAQQPAQGPTKRAEPAAAGPELSFGGQYRINSYTVDNDLGGGRQTASRVRIRQNVDIRFSDKFKTHLQAELGHTTDNVTTTSTSSRGNTLAVRHAVLDYSFDNGGGFQAGIVPLSDRFGDTLFSSDWDYNPVALSATSPLGGGSLRAFAANLEEGSETDADDDFVHYQLDYAAPSAGGGQANAGLGLINLADPAGANRVHANYGVGASWPITERLMLEGFVVGSYTEKEVLGTADDGAGVAAKIALISQSGFAVMATYASGDDDGSGFLPPMALARTNGYWGYTGLLTVQGPTDTGFDGDSVNISNNGMGLSTVQARYARSLTPYLDMYLAAGWFGNSDTPAGRDSLVGFDFLAMGTYRFTKILALDFGVAHAILEDAVSGYSNGVIGGTSFNQAAGKDRNKTAIFSRLQAEF